MRVEYVKPAELRQAWGFVRPGLEKIRARGHNSWIPEDIYTDCFEQRSMLWLCIKDDRAVGFFVLQPNVETVHMWAAHLESIDPMDLAEGLRHARNICREGGATKLTFQSNRKGWERRAKSLGFRPSMWEISTEEQQ